MLNKYLDVREENLKGDAGAATNFRFERGVVFIDDLCNYQLFNKALENFTFMILENMWQIMTQFTLETLL
jgi:hypothetical protein